MKLSYKFNPDATIREVEFTGCHGLERAGTLKEALGILQIENPAPSFMQEARAGMFHSTPYTQLDRYATTIGHISRLFRYPNEPLTSPPRPQMNALALLANAITEIARLKLAVQWYQDHEDE